MGFVCCADCLKREMGENRALFPNLKMARLLASVSAAILISLTLACAEEPAGPEFASDPRATRIAEATAPAATPAPLPTAPVVATPVDLATLLMSRGAPGRVYLSRGNSVFAVESDGNATQLLNAPSSQEIVALAPSPNRDEVAILLESLDSAQTGTEVIIVDASGTVVSRLRASALLATPGAAALAPATAVDWSPQGDRILIADEAGELLNLAVETGATEWVPTGSALGVLQPKWSPTGDRIAFIVRGEDRGRALRVVETRTGKALDVVPASDSRAVVEFAWAPDGASLFFTESGIAVGAASGVDLWRVGADGTGRELVASAGSVAPVARVASVTPSPDGRSVAYQVLIPGTSGPRFDSAWVRDVASKQGFRIELPEIAKLHETWWTDRGLLLWIDPGGSAVSILGESTVLLAGANGETDAIWTLPDRIGTPDAAMPAGTPVSS